MPKAYSTALYARWGRFGLVPTGITFSQGNAPRSQIKAIFGQNTGVVVTVFVLLDSDDGLLEAYCTEAIEDSDYYRDKVRLIYSKLFRSIKLDNILYFNSLITDEPLEEISYEKFIELEGKLESAFDGRYRIDSSPLFEV
jgi:hypothetical protein